MKLKKLISIVIPIYNESLVIPELIKRLTNFINKNPKYEFEIILVENGSEDESFKLLKKYTGLDKRFKVLQLSKNFGCDGGIIAGMRFAKGDACVIMMADLQEPVELIFDFIKKWEQGYEIVYGIVKKRTAGLLRNLNSRLFYKIINSLTNNMFPENASDFRLIDKKVYETINSMGEQNKYLRGLVIWTGFKHIGIPFNRAKRFAGESKADFKTALYVALNGIFSFSYLPLRLVSVLGVAITFISVILIVVYLYLYFVHGREAPGAATMILLTLSLFGILFFVLGIISEYLARIYDEVKSRPTYIVKNKVNLT
ncbi:MAG: Glycosyl transferase family 2 [Candidatus Roizmanbacteria bacterium GW2011_GWC2_37_13]|uniref:Glycosyl transferase family 2 n=1 Tax=Candidatus Roizmanbacteria bacterium GW2011_GWC2_37_13 TaxID=1618486 RepID=A0A0G0IRB2_9BACT|nr:MAG: glycosyltransferase, WcaA [Candidatus Roizmanbacteria bacterium GW2011_GWC1_37_12]KKQ26699.1 MAG: Glycosyl transferase family 2 [Candidatus Roizmanbacteria bacterium GW2011_GWC2_37_13]